MNRRPFKLAAFLPPAMLCGGLLLLAAPSPAADLYVYSGSAMIDAQGGHDLVADPLFVRAATNRKASDFSLRPGSPALGTGGKDPVVPALDLDGKPRGDRPSRGAYQS